MVITASLINKEMEHRIVVSTEGRTKEISIPLKAEGRGSSINGGEWLSVALATCCCNDIYREAARRGMRIDSVDVQVKALFGGEGEAARHIEYAVQIVAPEASPEAVKELITYVDRIAEIHNTLRQGIAVQLNELSDFSLQISG